MKKILCWLGFHNWAVHYVNGRMYRHATSRKCRREHCLKKQVKDDHAGAFSSGWVDENWLKDFERQQGENYNFINKKP